jgi:hypothetical protein
MSGVIDKNGLELALSSLEEAKHEVEATETELERLLSTIQVAPRAEKTSISAVVERALELVRAARSKMIVAEETLAKSRKDTDD